MAATNFAAQHPVYKLVWSRKTWAAARDQMFLKTIMGGNANSPVHTVTELTKTEKGDQCIYHLVADLVEDGVVGDSEREGREEAMQSYSQIITIDLLSHGIRNTGKMADQRTTINARTLARDQLSYWLANRCDQLAFLTLSGISYQYNCDGSTRPAKSPLKDLSFAADVEAPSTNRNLTWNGSALLGSGDIGYGTANVADTYVPKYEMIVRANAFARAHRMKPLVDGGKEYFLMLVHPYTYAQLKMDSNFQNAIVNAAQRGSSNPWFTGADVTIDGTIIKQHNLVYNTLGAASGSKWGSGSTVNGTRTLMLGAQALAMADLNMGDWVEKTFQYDTQWGVNIDKMFGLRKPKFYSIYDQSIEDFGVLTLDHYIRA